MEEDEKGGCLTPFIGYFLFIIGIGAISSFHVPVLNGILYAYAWITTKGFCIFIGVLLIFLIVFHLMPGNHKD